MPFFASLLYALCRCFYGLLVVFFDFVFRIRVAFQVILNLLPRFKVVGAAGFAFYPNVRAVIFVAD